MKSFMTRHNGEPNPSLTSQTTDEQSPISDRLCSSCQKLAEEALQYIVLELYSEQYRNTVLYNLKSLQQSAENGCQLCTLIFRSVVVSENAVNAVSDVQGENIEFYTTFLCLSTNTYHKPLQYVLKIGSDAELPAHLMEGCIDLATVVSGL